MVNNRELKKYDSHIVGYYGMHNSGDDALMHASIWGARHLLHNPQTSVGLYGVHSDLLCVENQCLLERKQAFPGHNRLIQYQAAIRSDSIIFGGGSVFHSESDINLKRHMLALSNGRHSRAVGVSLGPFQSAASERACGHFLNKCGFVGVRDQESFDIAKAIAPQANVEKTFDLAPLLICAQQHSPSHTQRKGIALSLCSVAIRPNGMTDEKAEQRRILRLCMLIVSLYQRTGEAITLLTLNGHETLGDWKVNQAIMNRLSGRLPITIKKYQPNPFKVLNELANYQAIISMRLHGSILGYLAKTPVISINYHTKCQGWCEQAGVATQYQFEPSNIDVDAITHEVEQGISVGFIEPTLQISTAITRALSNWSIRHEQAKIYSRYSAI